MDPDKYFIGAIGLVALLLLYLLVNVPQPTAEGYCTFECDSHIVYSDTPYIDWTICGGGCLIESIAENYDTTHPEEFKVVCKCCECVGSHDLELPDCEPPLGFIFRLLGRCK
jgi:hypothetical protein